MKTKIITLLAVSAILTLSFTFSVKGNDNKSETQKVSTPEKQNEPIGGFIAEDKI